MRYFLRADLLGGEKIIPLSSRVQVTGGSSGIGKAVAKEALKRGAGRVTLLARDKVRQFSFGSADLMTCLIKCESCALYIPSLVCYKLIRNSEERFANKYIYTTWVH